MDTKSWAALSGSWGGTTHHTASLMCMPSNRGDAVLVKLKTVRATEPVLIFPAGQVFWLLRNGPPLAIRELEAIPEQPDCEQTDWQAEGRVYVKTLHCHRVDDSLTMLIEGHEGARIRVTLPPACHWMLVGYFREMAPLLRSRPDGPLGR